MRWILETEYRNEIATWTETKISAEEISIIDTRSFINEIKICRTGRGDEETVDGIV